MFINKFSFLKDNIKNLRGWRTDRKLVAFAVDDYANVRTDSLAALKRLDNAGLELNFPFDRLDSVENRYDLEALFQVLDSVRDSRKNPAIFTAYTLSANPSFDCIRENGEQFYYEPITSTFERLAAEQTGEYQGVWELWCEGVERRFLQPQFHGREHLNIDLFEYKLKNKAPDIIVNIQNNSLSGVANIPEMPGIGFTHAFGLNRVSQLSQHRDIIIDGLNLFEKIWGFRSVSFTPPAQKLHPSLYKVAEQGGILSIDKPLYCTRSMGSNKHRLEINRSGRQRCQKHVTLVRNVVFEPVQNMGFDPVERALQQISSAFRWGKPAIISSHRVNFCGHLDESNRKNGLKKLKLLLESITTYWPDVEFVSIDKLIKETLNNSSLSS